jgi:hypothetical protein
MARAWCWPLTPPPHLFPRSWMSRSYTFFSPYCLHGVYGTALLWFIHITVSGTIWNDYKPQVEGLDKFKYTMVFMEQPGFGRSRPPDREFATDMYHRDADWGAKLMQVSRHNDNRHKNLEPDKITTTRTACVVKWWWQPNYQLKSQGPTQHIHLCFILGRSHIWIFAQKPATFTETQWLSSAPQGK